jgi:hypothetical protein
LDQRKTLFKYVLGQAVDRGGINATAVSADQWDVMPGYLIVRSIFSLRPTSTMLQPYGSRPAVRQLLLWEDDDGSVVGRGPANSEKN